MKRKYQHSEAWIAKHAEKVSERAAKLDSKKEAKKVAKEAKTSKKFDKKVKADKIKKVMKADKQPAVDANKAMKKAGKELMRNAKKLFGQTRKNSSAFKKSVKAYGKLISEALKIGDTKTIEKVMKLFGRLGFKPFGDDCVIENVFTVKVKVPKVKASKKAAKKEEKNENWVEQTMNEITVAVDPSTPIDPLLPEGPSDDELNDIEKEADKLEDIENDDEDDTSDVNDEEDDVSTIDGDESEDENEDDELLSTDQSRDREPLFDDNSIRGSHDDSFDEAMQDNGDWDE